MINFLYTDDAGHSQAHDMNNESHVRSSTKNQAAVGFENMAPAVSIGRLLNNTCSSYVSRGLMQHRSLQGLVQVYRTIPAFIIIQISIIDL